MDLTADATDPAAPAEKMGLVPCQTLKDVFLSCQALAPAWVMLAHRRGSQTGVSHMTKSLAMEWVGHGIRVNANSPGDTATPTNTRTELVLPDPDRPHGQPPENGRPCRLPRLGRSALCDGGACWWMAGFHA